MKVGFKAWFLMVHGSGMIFEAWQNKYFGKGSLACKLMAKSKMMPNAKLPKDIAKINFKNKCINIWILLPDALSLICE